MSKYFDGFRSILRTQRSVRMLLRSSLILTVLLSGMRLCSMTGLIHFSRKEFLLVFAADMYCLLTTYFILKNIKRDEHAK